MSHSFRPAPDGGVLNNVGILINGRIIGIGLVVTASLIIVTVLIISYYSLYHRRHIGPLSVRTHRRHVDGAVADAHVTTFQNCATVSGDETPHLPDCVQVIATLSNLTSTGQRYMYVNKANDFSLEIPKGAIPEGESITIDIGVALYGPFQYPEGLRPVSPVFWVCVRDKTNFQFLKPVTVSIPHFLNIDSEDDIESPGMTFLKGTHDMNSQNMYEFQPTDGDMLFEPFKTYGALQTIHFCYLCISSKVSRKQIRKAKYCLYVAIPRTMARCEPTYVYFFVTYLLSTCLETVKKQIMKIPELHNCISRSHEFQFSKDSDDPSIEIILPESWPSGWTVGLQFNTQVYTYMLET